MEMMLQPLRRYADFEGRASRSEYWLFALFRIGVGIAFMTILSIASAFVSPGDDGGPAAIFMALLALVMVVVVLGLFIPTLAVSVRRLHDTDKSGWLLLIAFIPFGGIVLLIFYCLDSTPGKNRFGPNPKGVGAGMIAPENYGYEPPRDTAPPPPPPPPPRSQPNIVS